MSEISFENFGYVAKKVGYRNIYISSSRYNFQERNMPLILEDIKKKLRISNEDTLLDVGCGLGFFLIPLSFFCKNVIGIDHKNFIEQIRINFKFFNKKNLISGNFLNVRLKKKFSKILVYSVVHYLSSEKEFQKFIDKSVNLLKKKGILLIGDIPIREYEKTFLNSKEGKKYYHQFENLKKRYKKKNIAFSIANFLNKRSKDKNLINIDLKMINNIEKKLKKKEFKVRIIRHNKQNIFNNTRIDLLIEKR